eukprot:7289403-Pyramimonas_sp.AAC.1
MSWHKRARLQRARVRVLLRALASKSLLRARGSTMFGGTRPQGGRIPGPGVLRGCLRCGRRVKGRHWPCLCGQKYSVNEQE